MDYLRFAIREDKYEKSNFHYYYEPFSMSRMCTGEARYGIQNIFTRKIYGKNYNNRGCV